MKYFKVVVSIVIFMFVLTPFVSEGAKGEAKSVQSDSGVEYMGVKETRQISGQKIKAQNTKMLQSQREQRHNVVQTQKSSKVGIKKLEAQALGQAKGKGKNQASDKAIQRRSRVASAVQEMLKVADRNEGVGQQIRTIAQTQNKNQEQIEAEMTKVKNRGQLKKFFFGPDYKNIYSIKEKLANHEEKLDELRQLASQITNDVDATKLQEQILVMEQIKTELANEVTAESKGFSLFGWLNKWLSK